jgi:putative heme-binding domain-containing protein
VPSAIRSAIVAALAGDDRVLLAAAIRAAGARPSAEFDVRLAAIAQDGAQEDALRLAALHAVAPRRPELVATSATLLEEWLSPSAAPALRLASAQVAACGTFDETALEALLARVQDDPLIAPDPLLPMLTRSTTGATAARVGDYLAAALQAGWRPAAPAASNDAHSAADGGRSTFERLLERLAGIDALAARRLADLAGQAPDAAARVEALRPLLSGGDPGRGRQVFLASRAACSTCHRIGGEGGAIGPDLTRIGLVRSGRDLLESIVVPSSTFAQGYETYLAVTADGQTFSGVLAAQDEQSLALCDAAGALRQFPRDALDELRRLPSSLMPEGLDRVLSPEELRDLLAFLASLR